MNWHRATTPAAWGLAGLMLTASAAAWSTAVPTHPSESSLPKGRWRASTAAPTFIDSVELAAAADSVRDRDPFRWERQPASVRFNPWEPAAPRIAAVPTAPSKPVLSLVGIVGGPPWTALLEGVPERAAGVLLRLGEQTGGIRLEEVRGDTARFSGFDTTWVLTRRGR
jgi:hypothetical protein